MHHFKEARVGVSYRRRLTSNRQQHIMTNVVDFNDDELVVGGRNPRQRRTLFVYTVVGANERRAVLRSHPSNLQRYIALRRVQQ
jgi:hypothetical protein